MNAATRQQLLDMWEKIAAHWENRDPGSEGPDGLIESIVQFGPPGHLVYIMAGNTLELFEPPQQDRWGPMHWFPLSRCCEERATIAAFCWAQTEAGDVE